MGFFEDLFGIGPSASEKAEGQVRRDITTGAETAIKTQQPFFGAGTGALGAFQGALGLPGGTAFNIEASPLFQFRKQQLEKDISTRLAAAGKLRAGASIAGQFAPAFQQLSLGETERQLNRLAGLINVGQTAAGQISGFQERLGTGLGASRVRQGAAETQRRQILPGLIGAGIGGAAGLAAEATGSPLGLIDVIGGFFGGGGKQLVTQARQPSQGLNIGAQPVTSISGPGALGNNPFLRQNPFIGFGGS